MLILTPKYFNFYNSSFIKLDNKAPDNDLTPTFLYKLHYLDKFFDKGAIIGE